MSAEQVIEYMIKKFKMNDEDIIRLRKVLDKMSK